MLRKDLTQHLLTTVLPFWENLTDWERGGWYGYVDKDLHVQKDAHKGCILNSRILWTFSTAARVMGDAASLRYARHAFAFLPRFEDKALGGLYWSVTPDGQPLDKTKHTYCQAFAIYGLAAYMRAIGPEDADYAVAKEKAMALFHLIEDKCSDEGGYGEAYEPDFSPVGNEKLSDNPKLMERHETASRTMNTLLHVLESYAELYRATQDEAVRKAGECCLQRFLNVMYSPDKRRLEVFFDRDYRSLLDMQSFGHDIEASWLMWDAVEALIPADAQQPYRDMCLTLVSAVTERAYTDHGLENEVVEGEIDHTRIWWVQAETVLGFMNAYRLTQDDTWLHRAEEQFAYIQRVFVDKRPGGEWYWSTSEDGIPTDKPIVEEWKCPYHNGRMCLHIMEQD